MYCNLDLSSAFVALTFCSHTYHAQYTYLAFLSSRKLACCYKSVFFSASSNTARSPSDYFNIYSSDTYSQQLKKKKKKDECFLCSNLA